MKNDQRLSSVMKLNLSEVPPMLEDLKGWPLENDTTAWFNLPDEVQENITRSLTNLTKTACNSADCDIDSGCFAFILVLFCLLLYIFIMAWLG